MKGICEKSKYKQKLISLLLAVLLATTSNLLVFTAFAGEDADESPLLGSSNILLGASSESYEEITVKNEEELRAIADRVNNGDSMAGFKINLETDIEIDSTKSWIPVGNEPTTPFSGYFDGQNHSISGFFVQKDVKGGLFGYLVNAKVTRLNLSNFVASHSTAGFFYSASNSTIDLSRTMVNGKSALMSLFSFLPTDTWDGTTNIGWYNALDKEFVIDSAEKFAGLAQLVNNSTDDFNGKTIKITKNFDMDNIPWTPIGKNITGPGGMSGITIPIAAPDVAFRGTVLGSGSTISNLKVASTTAQGGLFELIDGATVVDLTISKADINNNVVNGYAAILAGVVVDSGVTNITLRNSTLHGAGAIYAGGIAGGVYSQMPLGSGEIRNCLVDSCELLDADSIGGIAYVLSDRMISNCVVYNTKLRPVTLGGGIVAVQDSIGFGFGATGGSTIANNLVLGVTIDGSYDVSGIMYNQGSGACTFHDNFVSDIRFTNIPTIPPGFDGPHIAATNTSETISKIFTDSSLPNEFIGSVFNPNIANTYWDDVSTHTGIAPTPNNLNGGFSTSLLTNGIWTLDNTSWSAKENYYPQLIGLKNSVNSDIRQISGLASVAIIPLNPSEKYTTGAKELRLMKKTANGDPIVWSYTNNTDLIEDVSNPDYIIINTVNNAGKAAFDIIAETGGYKKVFHDVVLKDNLLEEDKPARLPVNLSVPTTPLPVISPTDPIKLTYLDPIAANPNVTGVAKLFVWRAKTSQWVAEQTILCDVSDAKFIMNTVSKAVQLDFTMQAGQRYRVELPEGMVKEAAPKDNLSEAVSMEFETVPVGVPLIKFINSQSLQVSSSKALALNDVLAKFKVFERDGGNVMYDYTVNPTFPTAYGGAWNANDPLKSMNDAFNNLVEFPANTNTVKYYLDTPSIISANPSAGHYRLYIMVKNKDNMIQKAILTISVAGDPSWLGNPPKKIVHIPWSDSRSTITSAAKQGATAVVNMNNGTSVPCLVRVELDEAMFEFATSESQKGGPSKVEAKVYALDQSGNPSATTSEKVTIYLDRPLAWTITPSPYTMYFPTKRQVEEAMNVEARNFKKDAIEYDHWNNTYRKPGLYYVDVTSPSQQVTVCNDPNCISNGEHPYDKVSDTFILNVVYPPGAEITNQWGKTIAEIEKDIYAQEIITIEPQTYNLPSYLIETLQKQEFGKMEIRYFDTYRWKLYSNTLNTADKWSDAYSLKVQVVSDAKVDKILNNTKNSVQLKFEHIGRLPGATEFELNVNELKKYYPNLPTKNLGLYRYNQTSNKLELVSDILVLEDNWASAILSEIHPTTYVLKVKGKGDSPAKTTDSASIKNYFLDIKDDANARTVLMTFDGKDITPLKKDFYGSATYAPVSETLEVAENTQKPIPTMGIALSMGVLVIAGVTSVIIYKKRSARKESK